MSEFRVGTVDGIPSVLKHEGYDVLRYTTAEWAATPQSVIVLAQDQVGLDTTLNVIRLGDGTHTWSGLSNVGGGGGTVTSVSVTTANGVSGSVATATTTPAISVTLGAITPTSVNGVTLAGTAATTMTFPPASANVGYLESPINSQANDYTGVLADSGKTILITGASKTVTIPANASVAYPVGTCLSFIFTNASGGSIAITSDTMTLANSTTTGTRTLAQNGRATAQKMTSTTWLVSGVGLT